MARQNHHIAITYQYRVAAENLAGIEEERQLGVKFGIQNCQYEAWEQATLAMTYSARTEQPEANICAAQHLLKMIIRKHGGRNQVRVLTFFQDAEDATNYYAQHLNNLLG